MILGLTILLLFRSYLPSIYYYWGLGMSFFPSFFHIIDGNFQKCSYRVICFFYSKITI